MGARHRLGAGDAPRERRSALGCLHQQKEDSVPRTARQLPPGVAYHLTTRGTNKRAIFIDDVDRQRFLGYLGVVTNRYGLSVLSYCLMGNHVHLLVRGNPEEVSAGMRDLLGTYARRFNRRARRSGHLFGERFHHVAVTSHDQIVATIRYVALNPVRAGMVESPEDWPWSSYAAILAGKVPSGTIDVTALLCVFGRPGSSAGQGKRALRRVVETGIPDALAAAARRGRPMHTALR